MSRYLIVPLLLASAVRADDAFSLLKYIPAQANTIAVINTASLLASPRAQKEGWAKLDQTEYLAGAVPLNPRVERMVFAKEFIPSAPGEGTTMALIVLNRDTEIAEIAKRHGTSVEKLGDDAYTQSRTGVCYFKFGDKLLGTIRSENKQEIARWVKYAKSAKESQLHRLLNAAAAQSSQHHITVALDSEHLFSDRDIDLAVAASKTLQPDAEQSQAVARFLKGLRGVVFTAQIGTDGIQARFRFESNDAVVKLKPDAFKGFIIETTANHGAMLSDLLTAKATAGDNSVTLAFAISDSELSRVMSLVLPHAAIPSDAATVAVVSGEVNGPATLKYFNAVNAIVDDLQAQNKKAQDYTKTALWHETAARKIELISTIGVDKAALEYGQGTATRLTMIADSLRGVPTKLEDLRGQAYAIGYRRIGWRWWGGADLVTNVGDIANKQAKVIKDDEKNRNQLWADIDSKRSEIKGLIAEKYRLLPAEKK